MQKQGQKSCLLKPILTVFLMISLVFLGGCWNYREINTLAIVLGCAIDRNEMGNYVLTVEIMNPVSRGTEAELTPVVIGMEGESIFDAARNLIARVGKKLYWSHAKVFIISEEIAKDGIIPILDWVSRDAEVRLDVAIFVSLEKTAREIFLGQSEIEKSIALQIFNTFRNQPPVTDFVELELWELLKFIEEEGITSTAATVRLIDYEGKKIPQVYGTAAFLNATMIGWLNGADSKILSWLMMKLERGLLVKPESKGNRGKIVYEVGSLNVKITPLYRNKELSINVKIELDAEIAELLQQFEYNDNQVLEELERELAGYVENRLKHVVTKVQKEFGSDIFGFGKETKNQLPEVWKLYSERWEEVFPHLPVTYDIRATITGTALRATSIRLED